ncbi:glycosyltransferase [Nakamurella flavida]|uniref:Glycosyltransferase n=1 Tax=Nakamurella flavida TaxID=363630 RepID=A0A938YI88_9ACTN|nr:glycosyltransferase [Nakamurella flavida]MBM9478176.1 glycosyltransferase [Nakamurella flavida]MDP9778602.1 glycosyltransferase involved in cell wall biosynthesis [Nakamurella flavida]
MTDPVLAWAVCGPVDHGVVEVADRIARADGGGIVEPDPARLASLADRLPPGTRVLHLHVTDWLFGGSAAAARVGELADRLTARGVQLTLTLHDLPQPSDGAELFDRRTSTYRELVARAAAVVVSSDHERRLLAEIGVPVEDVAVIPLAIDPLPTVDVAVESGTVGVFGYLYPGKGHAEVLEALLRRGSGTLVAVGRPSDRHADLVDELAGAAHAGGVGFRCTGYVPADRVATELRRVAVPVAPHTHVSASGSINSWLAAGRRPLVPAGRYVRELADRLPGSLTLYDPADLDGALERAFAEPGSTWLAGDLAVGPSTAEVAGRYRAWSIGRLG